MAAAYRNTMTQGCSELLGLAEGLLADRKLLDEEIRFLSQWLTRHENIASEWPGDVLFNQVTTILEDGLVSDDERTHLIQTLTKLVGGRLDDLAAVPAVNQLAFDAEPPPIVIAGHLFCLTGEFAIRPRPLCEASITQLGGIIKTGVSKKLHYLIVGGLGSPEWKHGSYGLKIAKAVENKRNGQQVRIMHEAALTALL